MAVSLAARPDSRALAGAGQADLHLVDVDLVDPRHARALDGEVEAQALDSVDAQRPGTVDPGGRKSCVPTSIVTGPRPSPG